MKVPNAECNKNFLNDYRTVRRRQKDGGVYVATLNGSCQKLLVAAVCRHWVELCCRVWKRVITAFIEDTEISLWGTKMLITIRFKS